MAEEIKAKAAKPKKIADPAMDMDDRQKLEATY